MALVAYDMSDASGSDDDEVDGTHVSNITSSSGTSASTTSTISPHPDDDAVGKESDSHRIFGAVPNPKPSSTILDSDNLKKLLLNKAVPAPSGKSERKTIKIVLPSLAEFEEDLPRPLATKANAAVKGSGLFSLLPPPKNSGPPSSFKLVPDSVKKAPAKLPIKPIVKLPKPILAHPVPAVQDNDDSDDDSTGDFFSLNQPEEPVPVAEVPIPETNTPLLDPNPIVPEIVQNSSDYYETSDVIPISSADLELDEEAMQRLCGGNKRKRNAVQAELIDVSEKDVVPDQKEWLLKALTEEKRTRSHKKGLGPSSTQKRKHQITYLAYQAKEQEQDLQNQWATNKMTKKQTQSKYGF